MLKISILLVLCCVLWWPQIEAQSDREYCERVYRACLRHQPRLGRTDETINLYNLHCDRDTRGRWIPISRCDMEHATCLLTLTRCIDLTCRNVAEVLGLNWV